MNAEEITSWAEAHGFKLGEWQQALLRQAWPPPNDKDYLQQRLNTRWRDRKDPGPWERDRMKR